MAVGVDSEHGEAAENLTARLLPARPQASNTHRLSVCSGNPGWDRSTGAPVGLKEGLRRNDAVPGQAPCIFVAWPLSYGFGASVVLALGQRGVRRPVRYQAKRPAETLSSAHRGVPFLGWCRPPNEGPHVRRPQVSLEPERELNAKVRADPGWVGGGFIVRTHAGKGSATRAPLRPPICPYGNGPPIRQKPLRLCDRRI